jgi:hypothetical protein
MSVAPVPVTLVARKNETQAAVGGSAVAVLAAAGALVGVAYMPAGNLQTSAYVFASVLVVMLIATLSIEASLLKDVNTSPIALENGNVAIVAEMPMFVQGGLGVAAASMLPAVVVAVMAGLAAFQQPKNMAAQTGSWIVFGMAVLAMILVSPAVGQLSTLNNQLPPPVQ